MSMAPFYGIPGKLKTLMTRIANTTVPLTDTHLNAITSYLNATVSSRADGSIWDSARAAKIDANISTSGKKTKYQKITGTAQTWTRPTNVSAVRVIAVGGGQGGAGARGSASTSWRSAAGGAGGDVIDVIVPVSSDLTINCGTGGGGGVAPGTNSTITPGTAGGNTTITGTGVSLTAYGGGLKHSPGESGGNTTGDGIGGGGAGAGGPPNASAQYYDATLMTVGGGYAGGALYGNDVLQAQCNGGSGRFGLGGGGGGGGCGAALVGGFACDGGGNGASIDNAAEAGVAATDGTGGGGGGAASDYVSTGAAGGDGGDGCVILVWEDN